MSKSVTANLCVTNLRNISTCPLSFY